MEVLPERPVWEEKRVARLVAERANEPTYPLEQVMSEVLGECPSVGYRTRLHRVGPGRNLQAFASGRYQDLQQTR
jgi:hypothetical protein